MWFLFLMKTWTTIFLWSYFQSVLRKTVKCLDVVLVPMESSTLSNALTACRVGPVKTRHSTNMKKAKGWGWGFVGQFRQSVAMQHWFKEPWPWCLWGVGKRRVGEGFLVEKRTWFWSGASGGVGLGDGVEGGQIPWCGNDWAGGGGRICAAVVEVLLPGVGA